MTLIIMPKLHVFVKTSGRILLAQYHRCENSEDLVFHAMKISKILRLSVDFSQNVAYIILNLALQ